jgi:cytidylate kinase
VKVYLDADVSTRTKRRVYQCTSDLNESDIEKNIKKRDEIDKNKPFGKLTRTHDAVYVDSTHLTIEEVCERVQDKILEAMKKR